MHAINCYFYPGDATVFARTEIITHPHTHKTHTDIITFVRFQRLYYYVYNVIYNSISCSLCPNSPTGGEEVCLFRNEQREDVVEGSEIMRVLSHQEVLVCYS